VSAKKVDNIAATVDLNGKQMDVERLMKFTMGSIRAKFVALMGCY
jgi:hypothetical protein